MAAVIIDNLSKQFGKVRALQPSDLHFEDRALSVIVGPSGCGKTTLMRLIAGLEDPTTGTIRLDDERIDRLPAWDRDIALVFQSYALYPHMTVFKNIEFPLVADKVLKKERQKRVQNVAQQLEISHLLKRKPRQLSGGQMQRVALGRALVRNPRLFLLDEPLSNLDAALRTTMRAEIKRLQHEMGTTMIYVTHDQVEAMTLAHQLIVMNHGVVQQAGTPKEIYDHPQNTFVAAFIGNPPMNILDCLYDPHNNRLRHGDVALPVPDHLAQRAHEIKFVGIRPEALQVAPQTDDVQLWGTIYVVEYIGKEIMLTVQLDETLIKVLAKPDLDFSIGDTVGLTARSGAFLGFDADGRALT